MLYLCCLADSHTQRLQIFQLPKYYNNNNNNVNICIARLKQNSSGVLNREPVKPHAHVTLTIKQQQPLLLLRYYHHHHHYHYGFHFFYLGNFLKVIPGCIRLC